MFEFQTRFPGVGTFHEHVSDDLMRGIATGQLRPGQRIPTAEQLMASYGYGRGVVRQAARTLEELGLIKMFRRSQGKMVLPGARELAQRELRKRAPDAPPGGRDIEVASPSGSYTGDEPRTELALGVGTAWSYRQPTVAELEAGTYGVDELVVDVVFPDGTTESYGIFHVTFKLPAPSDDPGTQ